MIRMHLENDLRQAIDCQEFVLQYQPIVALEVGQGYLFSQHLSQDEVEELLKDTNLYLSP